MTNSQGGIDDDDDDDDVKHRDLLFQLFTRQRYEAICVHKTALYTFTLPVLGNSGSVVDFGDILQEAHLSVNRFRAHPLLRKTRLKGSLLFHKMFCSFFIYYVYEGVSL